MHGSGESQRSVKQFFYFANTLFIDQEQDNVIIGFNYDIVMGDDDLLTQDCDFTNACFDPWTGFAICDTGPPVSGPPSTEDGPVAIDDNVTMKADDPSAA